MVTTELILSYSRKEQQSLAKEHGIKANQSNEVLRSQLMDKIVVKSVPSVEQSEESDLEDVTVVSVDETSGIMDELHPMNIIEDAIAPVLTTPIKSLQQDISQRSVLLTQEKKPKTPQKATPSTKTESVVQTPKKTPPVNTIKKTPSKALTPRSAFRQKLQAEVNTKVNVRLTSTNLSSQSQWVETKPVQKPAVLSSPVKNTPKPSIAMQKSIPIKRKLEGAREPALKKKPILSSSNSNSNLLNIKKTASTLSVSASHVHTSILEKTKYQKPVEKNDKPVTSTQFKALPRPKYQDKVKPKNK